MSDGFRKPRALVAEDDAALADILRHALAGQGFEVSVVYDGNKARKLAQECCFDLVTCDYQLPGLNGEQILESIRAGGASKEALLILCSAKTYELDCERLQERLGLRAIFFKPFSIREVIGVAREARSTVEQPAS
jgi:DNA-binding response OmpR family regulator